jgi:O-antigen/teichoic acid export membrane protein
MGVSLYTSRIVLSILGIEDFGIYTVVGGVVALFSFLNNTLSAATSRFITFELGTGNLEKLKKTFGSALIVHFILALIVLILAETVGLWFLENKLIIPENRVIAARIVYQLSVITTMIGIVRVPYNASIIAHERMNIYAYFSIIEVSLQLAIVYLLLVGNFDKLILYATLIFIVGVLMTFLYGYYASRHFIECRFRFCYEKEIVIPMLSFSGWDLYGNMSVMARTQGVNILQNMFFGPLINAAGGIATQVQNAVAGFAENFLTAMRPPIVKNYAQRNIDEMQKLVINASKFSFLLLFCISFPLILENKFILNLWLREVPDYAVIFCQLVLINNLISIIFRPIMYSIHATGKIKKMSFINGTVLFMTLPFSYYFLKMGFAPITPYILNIILLIVCCLYLPFILRTYIPLFSIRQFFKKSLAIISVIVVISTPIPFFLHLNLEEGWMRFVFVGISFVLCMSISTFFIALNKKNRDSIVLKIKRLR